MNTLEESPLLQHPPHIGTYGIATAFSTSINYIIGAGVLGLPNAFYQAGVPLTWITMLFFSCLSILCCWWVIESLSRSHLILSLMNSSSSSSSSSPPPSSESTEQPVYKIDPERRVTFFDMCDLFGGKWLKIFCEIVLALYCYGCLWAYVATFSNSLSTLILSYVSPSENCELNFSTPVCKGSYYGSIGLFACIVTPLTLIGLTEQKLLQVILAGYRFLAFGIMILTVIIGFAVTGGKNSTNSVSSSNVEWNVWLLHFSGFGLMFPTSVYATNVHYNLPDSLTPCNRRDKLLHIATMAELTAIVFYILIGTLCSSFFNPPSAIATLDWANYTGLNGGWGHGSALWWAQIIKLLVVLFPVLDLLNVYPLVSYSLSGNLEPLIVHFFSKDHKKNKFSNIFAKLIAVIPPLILGAALGSVEVIFTITGLCAFFIQYIVPSLLQYFSTRFVTKKFGRESASVTPYTGGSWRSGKIPVFITITIGLIAWIYAFVASFIQITKK